MNRTAIRAGRVSACAVFDSAMSRLCFESCVDLLLLPTLSEGDVVGMDNLPANKSKAVVEAIDSIEPFRNWRRSRPS